MQRHGNGTLMAAQQDTAMCQTCYGSGHVVVARASMLSGRIGTSGVDERCKDCKGAGHFTFGVVTPDPGPGPGEDAPASGRGVTRNAENGPPSGEGGAI